MNIATVIVDVPALGTDRAFDYLVPDKWLGIIEPGMRVSVPFGPRTIQGFVTGLTNSTNIEKLKEIKEPLDLTPVLNHELLELGHWLAAETLSFKISAFHAMLPAAMKAKYEKAFRRTNEETNPIVDDLFKGKTEITWKDAERQDILLALHAEIKRGNAEVVYYVKNRARKKTIRVLEPVMSKEEIENVIESLHARAIKQKEVLEFLLQHPAEQYDARQLAESTDAGPSTITALIKRGVLSERREEVYRDPYGHKTFHSNKSAPSNNGTGRGH